MTALYAHDEDYQRQKQAHGLKETRYLQRVKKHREKHRGH